MTTTHALDRRSLLVGLLMGFATLVTITGLLIVTGAMSSTDFQLQTGPFMSWVLIAVLAAANVGGGLLGYELSRRGMVRSLSWSLAVPVGVVAFVLVAPEGPTIREAHSDINTTLETLTMLLDAAHDKVQAGDSQGALNDILMAADLAWVELSPEEPGYCQVGERIVELGEQLVAHGGSNEARMVFAIGIYFAEDCPSLDGQLLHSRNESARLQWLMQESPGPQ